MIVHLFKKTVGYHLIYECGQYDSPVDKWSSDVGRLTCQACINLTKREEVKPMEYFVLQRANKANTQVSICVDNRRTLPERSNRYSYAFETRKDAEAMAKVYAQANQNNEYIVVEAQTGFMRDTPPIKRVDYK